MQQYLDLIRTVLEEGEKREDRTGTGTISLFGTQTKYDLRKGFPLLTTKKVNFAAVVRELLWFLKGSTNINEDLHEHTNIWDAWANTDGELGPIYGYQWRKWPAYDLDEQTGLYKMRHIDQIQNAIDLIKNNPDSRRIIVTAWNVADIPKMALPPCHMMFQFYVINGRLDCQLYQRSADLAVGVPFNIASYALLTMLIAQCCDLTAGELVHTFGDVHLYRNHLDLALRKLLALGKRKIGFVGLSFKTGTDDLRESPLVTLAEQLIGKGMQLAIYDPEVHLARLLGANRSFIEQHLPHIGRMMRAEIDAVIAESEVLVIGLAGQEIADTLARSCRSEQVLLDLVRLPNRAVIPARVEGLCW